MALTVCGDAQWRGGGKAHGPVPRSHEHELNRKVRQMGLRCALSVGYTFLQRYVLSHLPLLN